MTNEGSLEPVEYENGKYVVFKLDEFNRWWRQASVGGIEHKLPSPVAVDDAIVIRRQDVFAAPALASYANSILVAVEAMKLNQPYDPELNARLLKLASYFMEQSELAYHENNGKFPD